VSRPLRVLHCPSPVGGYASSLVRWERELGVESWCAVFQPGPYQYPADEVLWLPDQGRWRWELKRWGLLWRAIRRFDVVHFNFGQTMMPTTVGGPKPSSFGGRLAALYRRWTEMIDLPLLKRAGVKIAVSFQGDDARRGDVLRRISEFDLSGDLEPEYYTPESDEAKRRRIARFAKYADVIYGLNPDLLRVLPAGSKFLAYPTVDFAEWTPMPRETREVPVVLHAPTHRGIKGTRHVLAALDQLRAEGVRFELRLIEGKTHAEAKAMYHDADLVVDQLILGWYGGLALETMALAKPVVCHLRSSDLAYVPDGMREALPLIQSDPRSITNVLREWLGPRRHELADRGRQSREFAERWHDPRRIAASVIEDYRRIV
jgi:hypothetical protein